jgi:hypothetical protein
VPRTFEEMFRDYDKALADVETERVTANRKVEERYEGERKELMQDAQAHPDDPERRMWDQLQYENTYGNEARDIEHNNKVAEEKKGAIEADRQANRQERSEASGLRYDSGPIPEPPPPPPPQPADAKPLEAQAPANEQPSGPGMLRSMRDNLGAQLSNLTAAAAGIGMNVAASFHQSEADVAQHRTQTGIESRVVAGLPPEQHNVPHPPHLEPIETIETGEPRTQATTTRVESPPEPRMQTTVYGVDEIVRPPPPPPPPANDNPSESKKK